MPDDTISLEKTLRDIIGDDAYFALVEAFAGTRLFIPLRAKSSKNLTPVIGDEAVAKLSARYAPDYICVPLSREFRAVRHRRCGLSNGRIATRLGITESAVNRLFRRVRESKSKPSEGPDNDNRQIRLIKAVGGR